MTHNYVLVETLDTGALRLRCPECGRQIRLSFTGKVTEVAGNVWEEHRYEAADDTLRFSIETDTEER